MTNVTLSESAILAGLHETGYSLGSSQFTYSVPTAHSSWSTYESGSEPFTNYSVLNTQEAANFRLALAAWDHLIVPSFSEVKESGSTVGEVRAAFTDEDSDTWGYAYQGTPASPGGTVGDIWINSDNVGDSLASGTYGYEALLHEIGHTLGLKHPFEGTPLEGAYDDRRFTLMSYTDPSDASYVTFSQNGSSFYANSENVVEITPMVLDTAAVQAIYGADPLTGAGTSTYTFTQGTPVLQSIYDAGGTDTFDLSNFTRDNIVDLTPGAYSSIGLWSAAQQVAYWTALFPEYGSFIADQFSQAVFTFTDDVGIALNTVIEDAIGGSGVDTIIGNSAANLLSGGAGDDVLSGGSGNDRLDGGAGQDVMTGGTGNDTYVVDSDLDEVVEGTGGGTDVVLAAVSRTLGANVENLTLSGSAGLSGTGNGLANVIVGNAGANVLAGLAGNDRLDGGAGDDLLQGGVGDDTYVVDSIKDRVFEKVGEGTDTVLSSQSWTLGDNVENLTVTGHAALSGTGNALANVLTGNDGANLLKGRDGNDHLNGGAGNDWLDGGSGDDVATGGLGDDSYVVGATSDTIVELAGQGTDLVQTYANFRLSDNVENIAIMSSHGRTAIGNGLANLLTGGSGNDTLDGAAGDDIASGGAGNDTYVVGSTTDKIIEAAGQGTDLVKAYMSFTLSDNVENLTIMGSSGRSGTGNSLANLLTGNAGANMLAGFGGDDTIIGGAGDDTIVGGVGKDVMTGGAGHDRFTFAAGDFAAITATGSDRVTDFATGDLIDLSKVDAITGGSDNAFGFVGAAAFSHHAGELRAFQSGGNTYVDGDLNGDGKADFQIQLDGAHTLTKADFLL